MNKIANFVDVQNIHYTTRQAYGRHFNYQRFFERVSSEGNIVAATAYAIHRNEEKQLKFEDTLKRIGFTAKLMPYMVQIKVIGT